MRKPQLNVEVSDLGSAARLRNWNLRSPPLADGIRVLQELLLQERDAHVRGVKLTAQELGVIESCFGVEREGLELRELLTQAVDFQGPAGLVCLFAVLREVCGCTECFDFVLESSNIRGGSWWRNRWGAGASEQPVDAGYAPARTETLFQSSPK